MEALAVGFLLLLSFILGVLLTLVAQYYFLNCYIMRLPCVGPPEKPVLEAVCLPKILIEALQSSDIPKKESCLALNLLFQFLFKELRHAQKVRRWFRWKLSLEFEELLTRTTTGKLFDKVTIRDINLGTQFPAVKSITIKNVELHPILQHIECLDLCLDLEYSGGFQLSIDANMLLGKAAYLAVKVNHLSGQARLQFTRHPYTHWSFSFYNDPILELTVESQFQGRPLPQIHSFIVNQIRKSLKKKHTLPNYKLRYKPFFPKCEPGEEDEWSNHGVYPGKLQVTVVEVTRLMSSLVQGNIYCSVAVDSTAWVEVFQSETAHYMTLDLIINKPPSQHLGLVFKQEFVSDRYQACVVVETVASNSAASSADIRRSDILVAVEGKKVTSMAQVAKLIKAAGDRFTIRVERKSNLRIQLSDSAFDKCDGSTDKDIDSVQPKISDFVDIKINNQISLPGSPNHSGLRQRRGSGEKTESDSSGSTSVSGSPAKKSSISSKSAQATPEHSFNKNAERKSISEGDWDSKENCLQIHKTKALPSDQVMVFDETLTFNILEDHRYLNVSVWSKSLGEVPSNKQPIVSCRGDKDILLGHVSIPLAAIGAECSTSKLGHHIKNFSLLPPDPHTALNRNHKLSNNSGFEPCLCYGDILLSFLYSIPPGSPAPRPPVTPTDPTPSQTLNIRAESGDTAGKEGLHDFIRTHFHRTTQCEFCGKKIWLKDAVQCRTCSMTCHKKCVSKCQMGTICGSQRRASALCEEMPGGDLNVAASEARRASVQPEIITTVVDDTITNHQQQGQKKGFSGLLATVASAAQAHGLKRTGSAHSLAPPTSTSYNNFSRSLPPSPQHSPNISRKASLVGNPFQFSRSPLDDDVSAALDQLLQRPGDDDLMALAKSTGKELYASLSLPERREKINNMITKLKAAMDAETQSRMMLSKEEQEAKDTAEQARIAFLIGKSDEKVQALAVLMLHFCAGLQHAQDQEEANKKTDFGLMMESGGVTDANSSC